MNHVRHRRALLGAWVSVLVLATLWAEPVRAEPADDALATRVKAAFLFNFVKFTIWPQGKFTSPSAPIVLCVLEPDPFGETLEKTIADKNVNGRPLLLYRSNRAADLLGCHLAYLGASDASTLAAALKQLAGHSILLVHENTQALQNGGIRFMTSDRYIRFEVNLTAIENESLQLSSKLLALSSVVRQ